MAKPKKGPRLGAGPQHQKLLLANQASDLFRHGRIRTTEAKAKQLRPYAERLITKAKRGDLHARRQVLSKLRDRDVVAYLFEDIAPRFADRNGGYTRILKLAPRQGDNARMALIELVDQGDVRGDEEIEQAKRQRARGLFGRLRRDRDTSSDEPDEGFDEVEEELEQDTIPDLEDVEESPPGVDDEPDASDLPAELDDEEQKGPGPEGPPAKGDDLKIPDEQREINPDAGDTTGS